MRQRQEVQEVLLEPSMTVRERDSLIQHVNCKSRTQSHSILTRRIEFGYVAFNGGERKSDLVAS